MDSTITPFLWFDGRAEEAMTFYTAIFPDSKVLDSSPTMATFELAGQRFIAFNGGPQYKFSEAISFFVNCETQAEIDRYWELLGEGGTPIQCGWIKDKFGLCWQIVPEILSELLGDDDEEKSSRVMQALLGMIKLDIAGLQAAYDGK
jgi:predicted 3-demethylubiquinone-9 3-methyltransferase (glyoxalase superfamily)